MSETVNTLEFTFSHAYCNFLNIEFYEPVEEITNSLRNTVLTDWFTFEYTETDLILTPVVLADLTLIGDRWISLDLSIDYEEQVWQTFDKLFNLHIVDNCEPEHYVPELQSSDPLVYKIGDEAATFTIGATNNVALFFEDPTLCGNLTLLNYTDPSDE